MKTPEPPSSPLWVAGPSLTSSSDLLAWLNGDGAGKTIDLPIQVVVGPLGISKAQLAPPGRTADDTGLLLKLDDTRMGISLKDRLRDTCSSTDSCWVWLRGSWGATVTGPGGGPSLGGPSMPSTGPTAHPFSVYKVMTLVSDDDAPVVRLKK
ncbi:MAG: hypothetical protein AB8H79_05780 [Myxococcota bacterium]